VRIEMHIEPTSDHPVTNVLRGLLREWWPILLTAAGIWALAQVVPTYTSPLPQRLPTPAPTSAPSTPPERPAFMLDDGTLDSAALAAAAGLGDKVDVVGEDNLPDCTSPNGCSYTWDFPTRRWLARPGYHDGNVHPPKRAPWLNPQGPF
jgi:hypothetical protein